MGRVTDGEPEGATPLTDEERDGLIPKHITTREELNQWESSNIEHANVWALGRRRQNVISIKYIQLLHKRMFDNTWTWAGTFRLSDKNIGVNKYNIGPELQHLCDDVAYWKANEIFSLEEIAARYHHRLAKIHPFANGNGRHARLSADVFLAANGLPRQSMGSILHDVGAARLRYIEALQAADYNNYAPLLRLLGVKTDLHRP